MLDNLTWRDTIFFCIGGVSIAGSIFICKKFQKPATSRLNFNPNPASTIVPRNGAWKVGENQPSPYGKNYQYYDPKELSKSGSLYNLLISSIVPRPIALVSSQNKSGSLNCAPFSYFNVILHEPPLIALGLCTQGRKRLKKDTLINIEETGEFVVNIMSTWFIDSANHTSGNFPPEVNEMEVSGLYNLKSTIVAPPRVGESAVQFECQVHSIQPILNDNNEHTGSIVIGRIVAIHVNDDVLDKSDSNNKKPSVSWEKLSVLGRLGGDSYTIVNNALDLKRPDVKKS